MENGTQVTITNAVKGRRAMYAINSMHFAVIILDARKVYGRVDALIQPVDGVGEKWVAADQLRLAEGPAHTKECTAANDRSAKEICICGY